MFARLEEIFAEDAEEFADDDELEFELEDAEIPNIQESHHLDTASDKGYSLKRDTQ